jgi:hypothetical protein
MQHPARATIVRTFADMDAWMGAAVRGKIERHQLWLGRPGSGKTARLHRHIKNRVEHDMFPGLQDRAEAPIYSGRITPAKWFIRGWQHHLEPLLALNDVSISRIDESWESMLVQFLETAGTRTIRWDLKSHPDLSAGDETTSRTI